MVKGETNRFQANSVSEKANAVAPVAANKAACADQAERRIVDQAEANIRVITNV